MIGRMINGGVSRLQLDQILEGDSKLVEAVAEVTQLTATGLAPWML